MKTSKQLLVLASCFLVFSICYAPAEEAELTSPDGKLKMMISDDGGPHYRVAVDSQPVLADSRLGLEFQDGIKFGAAAVITKTKSAKHDGTWQNHFGKRLDVRDHWRELRLTLQEQSRTFGLIVRAYDDGVAFRYDLPEASQLGHFVLTNELTEFNFAGDWRCWYGEESACAENHYPEATLATIPPGKHNTLPLLVQTPAALVAVAESDLLDWSGMSVTATGSSKVKVLLDARSDGAGLVSSTVPRVSPWRVLMIGRSAADLVNSDVIANLATPNRLSNVSWVKPGVCAWDVWWTGTNTFDPAHTGVFARGTTPSHKEDIDFAAEMGWPYQLMDWFWYEHMTLYDKSLHSAPNAERADFTPVREVDVPGLIQYAKSKNVREFVWAHSLDVETYGVEKTLAHLAELGFAGVKIDFLNSQSQETVQWCENVLATAAKHHLMVDLHGMYKPTGLARTYPNFITQEGVLGNEYNKLDGNKCTPLHTITLPFTRALLGPMDFTPGGFLNRRPADFQKTVPAEVMGTRARQLAMTVIYPSPLLVLCDSPANYRGQSGVEFFRSLPTVWDETVVLNAEVAKSIVIARRAGDRWYLAAMNGDDAAMLDVPLKFLGGKKWDLHEFADQPDEASYEAVLEKQSTVDSKSILHLNLLQAGGYAAVLCPTK